ncbi:MAG: hypothetical protein WBP58_15370 [Chitinophagaceae bacterium]
MYPPSYYNLVNESDKHFIHTLGEAIKERDTRITRSSTVEVYDYQPSDIQAKTHLAWSGSVCIILAPKNAPILDRVRKAVMSKSNDDLAIANELKSDAAKKTPVPYEDAVKMLKQQPVFASIKYKSKVLTSCIFVPGGFQAYSAGIPYNGGPIEAEAFELVEHLANENTREGFTAIILKRAPDLTEAEKYAIGQLKDDELNLGVGIMCYAPSAVTIAVTVCAATSATCPHDSAYKRGLKNPDLGPDIKSANPELIARRILNSRREVIEGIIQ